MYDIYLSFSVGMLTMIMSVISRRTNYGDECDFCHRLIVCQLYLAKKFFWR
jgi:hypothetical protein